MTDGDVAGASVFFHPRVVTWPVDPICTFAAPPLLREMMSEASRWKSEATESDQLRDSFFCTLALLCKDWMQNETSFWLPNTTDPQLLRAIDFALEKLRDVHIEEASAAAAMSQRTFRRRFAASLGVSWRSFLLKARLLRAMELLTYPGTRVTDVALEVGFDSPSAFAKAFYTFTGETPKAYQIKTSKPSRSTVIGQGLSPSDHTENTRL